MLLQNQISPEPCIHRAHPGVGTWEGLVLDERRVHGSRQHEQTACARTQARELGQSTNRWDLRKGGQWQREESKAASLDRWHPQETRCHPQDPEEPRAACPIEHPSTPRALLCRLLGPGLLQGLVPEHVLGCAPTNRAVRTGESAGSTARRHLGCGKMPPGGAPQPKQAQQEGD